MLRVYIAAPKAEQKRAQLFASWVRRLATVDVVSSWHDTMPEGAADPVDRTEAGRILAQNLLDLADATLVVALPCVGHGVETYVEIGRALARGVPVVMSSVHGGLPLSWADDGVDVVEDDDAALRVVARTLASRMRGGSA